MADLLNIGTNAVNTFKRALDVTGHNVANIGTEGYSRQRVDIQSNAPSGSAADFSGGGSRAASVDRIYASYIQDQLVKSNSLKERYDEQLSLSKQVEGIVASNDQGIQDYMQRMFDAFQNLSNNPTSSTNKQQVLSEAENMRSMLSNASNVLQETQDQANEQLQDQAKEVNGHLETINAINKEVELSSRSGGQLPNDLLDQRDQAIKELSGYIDIKTFRQENGRVDIHTGDGRLPLISDNTLTRIQAERTEYRDENRYEVFMQIGGQKVEISDRIQGGKMGGLLDFRENMLDPALNDLGVALNGMTAAVNWQHYQGYDENGNPGDHFFKPPQMDGTGSVKNTGAEDGSNISVSFNPLPATSEPPFAPTGTQPQPADYGTKKGQLDTALSAVGEMKSREYRIEVGAAGSFEFYDRKSGENLTAQATEQPAASDRYQLDGLEFDLSGLNAPDVGDQFVVMPHKSMIKEFDVALKDPQTIATRGEAPLPDYDDLKEQLGVTTTHLNNTTHPTVNGKTLKDRFDEMFGATPSAFDGVDTNGDDIITQAEYEAGIESNTLPKPAGEGDNTNIANIASLQSKELLFNNNNGDSTETLLGGYSRMATNVGMYTRSTDIQLEAQTNVFEQITQRREAYSGVNLDEEAANLMRYQQAYQSSAQIIQTSQTLFQTLIGSMQ